MAVDNSQVQVGSTKETVGILDASLQTEGDVLAQQAVHMARARNGAGHQAIAYEAGGTLPDSFVEEVGKNRFHQKYIGRSLSADTINQLTQGELQRDQQYVGNNSEWTGYYLEPLAKFVVPFDTPVRNMLPRMASPGIDEINWRAITSVFGGNGPQLSNFVLAQWNSTTTATPNQAQYTWVNKKNILRMLAWSDAITFESEMYGSMFEPDVRAKIAAKLAPALMVGQEFAYLNGAQYLWAPAPVNTLSTATTGGNLAATTTYYIAVTAVNGNGETLAFGGSTPTLASITTGSGSTNTISFNINRVPGAASYNVYVGTSTANSALYIQVASKFGGASALNDIGGLASGYMNVTLSGTLNASGTTYARALWLLAIPPSPSPLARLARLPTRS